MPVLKIQTNAKVKDVELFKAEASLFLRDILRKPEKYVMVLLEKNQDMMLGGSSEPLAYIELKSINLPETDTKVLAAKLCAFIQEKIAVQPNRIYIEFSNAPRHMFGWDSTTFER